MASGLQGGGGGGLVLFTPSPNDGPTAERAGKGGGRGITDPVAIAVAAANRYASIVSWCCYNKIYSIRKRSH